jgi:Nucleotidyl transferase AbiEii toxin, Type IV TA system
MLICSLAVTRPARIFRELCVLELDDDGLRFDAETVEAERISEDANYEGVRATFVAYVERAKVPIQIDIGFGDVVTPAPSEIGYPTLLEFPGTRLLAYPKETVVARSTCGTRNRQYPHEGFLRPGDPVSKVRVRRKNSRPGDSKHPSKHGIAGLPVAFTFYDDVNKKRQWTAFCVKNKSCVEKAEFKTVMEDIRNFLALPVRTVQEGDSFTKTWKPGGPWR